MLLVKKCQFFLYLDLVKIRPEIMLNYFEEKKETLFEYKKTKFFKVQKIAYLSMLLARKCHFFLSLDLIKIRLEIILLSLQ